jgi:NAD(P)-dependent dehydrogenase (short-subunit alcohol dehydrogenase family)
MSLFVVAGGTSGIGRSCVLALLSEGHHVIAVGRSDVHADELRTLARLEDCDRLSIVLGDLAYGETACRVADLASAHGKVKGLVNSAGTIGSGGIERESYDVWRRTLDTNLNATYNLTKALLPFLKNVTGASIVNVSSTCSVHPCTSVSYSVSKAALDMLTRHLCKDLARYGIRVNSVNPGAVETNLQLSAGLFTVQEAYRDWLDSMAEQHPLGPGTVLDVRAAILFLLSSDARWISGTSLYVDGGRAA